MTRTRRDSVGAWILIALGLGGFLISGFAIPVSGIGWDSGIDSLAAENVRAIESGVGLVDAYEDVFATSEFYGVLVQWTANSLGVFLGGPATIATNALSTYQLQSIVSLALFTGSAVVVAAVVCVLFASRVAGAFTFATICTLPYLSGLAIINFKDAPVAAGLTLVSSGLALLWRRGNTKWVGAAITMIAIGTFVALGVRIGAWVLVGGVAGVSVAALVLWRVTADRRTPLLLPMLSTTGGLAVGLFGVWMLNPIARINFPRWAWDAFVVSRSYPWIGEIRTFGRDLVSTDLPWWYVPSWFVAQSPVLFLGFVIIGLLAWLMCVASEFARAHSADCDRSKPRAIALTPFAGQALALPIVMVASGATLYDGIRHLSFAIPALVVLTTPLVMRVLTAGSGSRNRSGLIMSLMAGILIAIPVTNLAASIRWFPYMYAHVNLPTAAFDSDRDWEYDYWGTTVLEGASRLRQLGVSEVVVLPEIDRRGTAEVADILRVTDTPNDGLYGVYVFRRFDSTIPAAGCERVFQISRAGVVLGEAAICGEGSGVP